MSIFFLNDHNIFNAAAPDELFIGFSGLTI